MPKKIKDSSNSSLKQEDKLSENKGLETDLVNNKVIRDTFTLAEKEYFLIEKCKKKLLANELSATKSEVLRTALVSLDKCSNSELLSHYNSIAKVKQGRPKYK